jgi:hypothetical protein
MNLSHFITSICKSGVAAMLTLTVVFGTFLVLEPTVGRSATDVFEITQTVTDETSFVVATNDVTMSPSLAGLTGGTASGSTTVRVRTNNATGYNMTIQFSTTTAMTRDGGGGNIPNYAPAVVGTPDYTFASEVYGQFAYTVIASSSGTDLNLSFRDNGSNACGAGTGNLASTCWMSPSSTAAKQVISTNAATLSSGSTSTLAFRVNIPSNPTPSIAEGTYTATATLTAVNN